MARTPAGLGGSSNSPRLLQCPVLDRLGRMNFPSRHPLNHSFRRNVVVGQADVILAIEINDHWAALNAFHDRIVRTSQPLYKPTTKIITLGVRDMYLKANFQDFGRFDDIDLAVAGDGEASLPALTEAVRRRIDAGRKSAFEARGKQLCGGAARHGGAGQIRCHGRLGCEPDHHRRGCVPRFTRRSRTTTGRWSATPSAMPGRTAYGNSTSRISGSASRAAPASATMPRLRSAPRSPISAMAV